MRLVTAALILISLISLLCAQGSVGTEGGNISSANVTANASTKYWGGIVGWLNGSAANINLPVSEQNVSNTTVYTNEPDGVYATFQGTLMMVTRLPIKPGTADITSPVPSDFNETGMFSNFTAFSGVLYNETTEDPEDTFCNPCVYTNCVLNDTIFPCPFIMLNMNTPMAVLKFDNGTTEEPVFLCAVQSLQGYNGTFFDFEYIVPVSEYYYFYLYPPNEPPNVTIITPEAKTYDTEDIPLVYNITDDGTIDSCWYILDGTRYDMPACGPAYVLTVGDGTHTLTLFANDTLGAENSDTVTFEVELEAPPEGPPGGASPGVPYYPEEGPPPPPPPEYYFSIIPENIYVTVDYPNEGSAGFNITSNYPVEDISCFVTGDFAEYTTVELDSGGMEANETLAGTITVDMPPDDILDYDGETLGMLQCTANEDPVVSSSFANVHLILNRPKLQVENVTIGIITGEEINASVLIKNIGTGNATAINLLAEFQMYEFLFSIYEIPEQLGPGEQGYVRFTITIPDDMEDGVYRIPLEISENRRVPGTGYLELNVTTPEIVPPPIICVPADLGWTLIILLLGLIAAIIMFKKKLEEEVEAMPKKLKGKWSKYKRPLKYAVLAFLPFLIIWILIILALPKCV